MSVAPLAGAWIETHRGTTLQGIKPSHPSRVRGLKLWPSLACISLSASHPSRVRGLKHCDMDLICAQRYRRTPRGCVD